MQNNITLKNFGGFCRKMFLLFAVVLMGASLSAQTVSTASGTNYNGDYSINNPAALIETFVVQNNGATPVAVTGVSSQMAPYFGTTAGTNSVTKLYYSATSLSGVFDVTTAAWTQIATGSAAVPPALAEVPVISGINFIIPANTQYRFALELSKGMAFSVSPVPTPNTFTNGPIVLKVGNFVIGGSVVGYAGVYPAAPAGNSGVFFGGTVNVVSTVPCAGTPAPGNTVSTVPTVCPGIGFTLSPQNITSGSGVTYQWQSSAVAGGPFVDIAGATNSTYTTTQTAATYYRVNVTCSGATTATTPIQVLSTPQSGCYCTAGAVNTAFEKISKVQFAQINRSSTSTAGYENFLTDTATVERQASTPITVTLSSGFSSDQVLVWIDLNQDGDFVDAGELVYTSAMGVGPHTGTITIPATALLGTTRMRVRMHDTSFGANATPCGNSTYGQVEDYTVKITPCIPVTVTAQPTNTSIQCGGTATFKLTATGTALTYLWQQRDNATAPWNNLTNGGVYSGVTSSTLTITSAPVTYNGYQYRVIYTGGCSGTEFSSAATLTVTPLLATLSPVSSAVQCTGPGQTAQVFTITNVPTPVTTTFTTTTPKAIPDEDDLGVLSPITVSGIPVGAVISEVKVTMNISHTWVGDLDINIKAPNNANLNLAGSLDGGTGSNGSDNFTNTVISSIGTVALSGAPAPRTGTYKADALAGYGPTGNTQTVTSFNGLTSVINGVWNLAAADFFAGDVGTINNWSISFSYGVPATGIWSPITGLFTDAALTIPYAGQPINTVYALPGVTTVYSVVVTTPTCVSAPLSVPVTVNTPITGTSTVANKSVCIGGNTTFTSTAPTTGSGIQHQWQVSSNGGATYTNVANTGVYTGATTGSLTITGATAAMNNYKFRDSLYVTSCGSSLLSSAGTLTVNPLPVVVINASPSAALLPGLTTTLTAAVSPNAGATYTWYRDGVVVPGALTNTLSGINVDALGSYYVVVNDINGCTGTSNTVNIRDSSSASLFIYPNANTGKFNVRLYSDPTSSYYLAPRFLNVYDSKGARIYSKQYSILGSYTNMPVDISNFGSGIYTVEVADSKGVRIKTGHVVVL